MAMTKVPGSAADGAAMFVDVNAVVIFVATGNAVPFVSVTTKLAVPIEPTTPVTYFGTLFGEGIPVG
jgi:hypothetical protein